MDATIAIEQRWERRRLAGFVRYLGRNRSLVIGLSLLLALVLFSAIGYLVWDASMYRPLSAPANRAPS